MPRPCKAVYFAWGPKGELQVSNTISDMELASSCPRPNREAGLGATGWGLTACAVSRGLKIDNRNVSASTDCRMQLAARSAASLIWSRMYIFAYQPIQVGDNCRTKSLHYRPSTDLTIRLTNLTLGS